MQQNIGVSKRFVRVDDVEYIALRNLGARINTLGAKTDSNNLFTVIEEALYHSASKVSSCACNCNLHQVPLRIYRWSVTYIRIAETVTCML